MPKSGLIRIGVDTGGTFTDCVTVEGSEIRILKVFSTPDDAARGIVEGVQRLVSPGSPDADSAPNRERRAAPLDADRGITTDLEVIHGTTVGTNTLLERKGARVALITTAGFEDLIEIGRQNRPRLYDLAVQREPPLVPRELRFGVRERTAADGSILLAPKRAEQRRLVSRLRKARVESLALCFLFAYANPANERAVAKALRDLCLPLSISHEILPEFREYERICTVVVNAYLAPRLSAYLSRLEGALRGLARQPTQRIHVTPSPARLLSQAQADAPQLRSIRISVMQSSGGITTAGRAAGEPVRTILSGPAGGVVATARLAERLGIARAISFDMGGTSTDVSLIDGAPRTTRETTLAGLPVAVPVLDVHSVGAGGGSLARVDAGGALRVGPESAGAVPGPVCYSRGGDRPTVTDAHLILGRLDAENFLGGSFQLNLVAAQAAFERFLSERAREIPRKLLPKTPLDLARGIVAVANATMERAFRVISVERGHDPREFSLVSFGGAGGLHAADLARALGLAQVIVPQHPGAFSALGVLLSDVVKDVSQSVLLPVPARGEARFLKEIKSRFAVLKHSARAEFRAEGFQGEPQMEHGLDLRYVGQSYELTVPFKPGFRAAFPREHERAYGHAQADRPLEIVSLRLRLVIKTPKPESARPVRRAVVRKPRPVALLRRKPVWFDGKQLDTAIYERTRLDPGTEFHGPAVVVEYSSTTVVPPDYHCRVDREGNLMLRKLDD
jgi:N-methylhydantoinase A